MTIRPLFYTNRPRIRRSGRLAALVILATFILGMGSVHPPMVNSFVSPSVGPSVDPSGHESPWSWPLNPQPGVERHFQPPPEPWLAGHRGVDLRAETAQEVTSPSSGKVLFVGFVVDRPVITIDHGAGLLSSFEPVKSHLSKGDTVTDGQQIGSVVSVEMDTQHCPASCLHWGVRLNGVYVNPLNYVSDRRPSVLLPLL